MKVHFLVMNGKRALVHRFDFDIGPWVHLRLCIPKSGLNFRLQFGVFSVFLLGHLYLCILFSCV